MALPEWGWVIEHANSPAFAPNYFSAGKERPWSVDHLDAVQFARQVDAERFRDVFLSAPEPGKPHRVAEHGWG